MKTLKYKLEKLSKCQQFNPEIRAQMQEQAKQVQSQIDDVELMIKLRNFERNNFVP